MIIHFKHKGLERFYRTGSTAGIQAAHARKISRILARLESAQSPNDLNIPGWRLHALNKKEVLKRLQALLAPRTSRFF